MVCKRCIELDVECFRLLEIIFGFIRKDPTKCRFYDSHGLPNGVSGRNNSQWRPKEYGNGEMSLLSPM